MKITFDIPDENKWCNATFTVANEEMVMSTSWISRSELKDGAVIKLPREKKEGADNG